MRFIINKFRIFLKIIGIIFIILSSIIIFGIEIYNHSKRVELENICYNNHNSTKEKLTCCLEAEYIWNEGSVTPSQFAEYFEKSVSWASRILSSSNHLSSEQEGRNRMYSVRKE